LISILNPNKKMIGTQNSKEKYSILKKINILNDPKLLRIINVLQNK